MTDRDRNHPESTDDALDEEQDTEPIVDGDSTTDPERGGASDADSGVESLLHDRVAFIPAGVVRSRTGQQVETVYRPSTDPMLPAETDATAMETVGTVRNTPIAVSNRPVSPVEPAADVVGSGETAADKMGSVVGSVGVGVIKRHSPRPLTDSIRLREVAPEPTETFGTIRQRALTTEDQSVTTVMTPDSTNTGHRPEPELEDRDPGYNWTGGTPYATTTPQCIVHVDPDGVKSLPFLQRVLRDTYTELEGGQPRTETLTSRAGTLERPRVHGAVVTLDLTTEEWTVDIDTRVSLTHGNQELLPEVQALVDSLYGGELGFLIINIAADVLVSRISSSPKTRFVAALLDESEASVDIDDKETLLSTGAPPVRIAEPRYDTPAVLRRVRAQYFGFDIVNSESETVDDLRSSRVAELEAAQEARIRRNDWRRIALTERQDEETGDESDEHYLWKAALANGLAWELREAYVARNEDISFDQFVRQHLVSGGRLDSEADISDGTADLCVSVDGEWEGAGVEQFLNWTPLDPSQGTAVALEFETGRAEGAFHFRKLRETLDGYDEPATEDGESVGVVCIVVPPRVLFRSESRAWMIYNLVSNWQSDDDARPDAALCVPDLGKYGCRRLIGAERLLSDWFDERK